MVDSVTDAIQGDPKKVNNAKYTSDLKALKDAAKTLNTALKGKSYLVGDKVTLADLAVALTWAPAFQLALDPGFLKSVADMTKWFKALTALPEVVKSAGHIKCCAKALKPGGASDEKPAKKESKKKDDDDMDDLFGDDDEADADAAKKAAEAAKDAAKKKKKKEVIAQSLVMFEVKPLDSDTDLDKLAARIFEIKMDGLYWKT